MYKYQIDRHIPTYRADFSEGKKIKVNEAPIVQVEGVYGSLQAAEAQIQVLAGIDPQIKGISYHIKSID